MALPAQTLLLGWVLAQVSSSAGTTDRVVAYNLTWKSTNFKTILEWKPKPINHVYTVQISCLDCEPCLTCWGRAEEEFGCIHCPHRQGDWENKCFHTTDTECDLTDEVVKNVKQTYLARVLSYPAKNAKPTSSSVEPDRANAPEFTPYLETNISQPAIQSFEQVGTKLNVTVQDARTLVRMNGTFLSLREVFGEDLSYILYYWKVSATRRKSAKTNTNEFLIDVEKGKNYCFSVQAVIPTRIANQKSPESIMECTSQGKGMFREMFFIIGAIVFAVIIFLIVLPLTLYKCRRVRAERSGKENSPLNAA